MKVRAWVDFDEAPRLAGKVPHPEDGRPTITGQPGEDGLLWVEGRIVGEVVAMPTVHEDMLSPNAPLTLVTRLQVVLELPTPVHPSAHAQRRLAAKEEVRGVLVTCGLRAEDPATESAAQEIVDKLLI